MKTIVSVVIVVLFFCAPLSYANYQRNQAVPVEKVLFGEIDSVRHINQQTLVRAQHDGWKTFAGALIGGTIGHQFGGGSGKTAATVLGAMIGGHTAHNTQTTAQVSNSKLIELLITDEANKQYMVIQDQDPNMLFQQGDKIRLVYLSDNSVRVDKAY